MREEILNKWITQNENPKQIDQLESKKIKTVMISEVKQVFIELKSGKTGRLYQAMIKQLKAKGRSM